MSQVQPASIYKQGLKPHVYFTSLKQLEKFEPGIFKMFRQIKDGEHVETAGYSYRLRDSGRFGFSVTRFAKDKDKDNQQQQTQPQQSNTVTSPIKKSVL